jgi:hypothetical protein
MSYYSTIIFSLCFFIFFPSCTSIFQGSSIPRTSHRGNQIDESLRGLGREIIRNKDSMLFRLPPIPHWISFNEFASCRYEGTIDYLDYDMLFKHYQLSYREFLFLQMMWNEKKEVRPSSEESLFFSLVQKIQTGNTPFQLPATKKIQIIWLDPYLKKKPFHFMQFWNQFMDSAQATETPVIFMSLCLNQEQLRFWLKEKEIGEESYVGLLSAEMTSIYNGLQERVPYFSLQLKDFFKEKYQVLLRIPSVDAAIYPATGIKKYFSDVTVKYD